MKFLFASDSFKGTLSSEQTVELLAKAAKNVFGEIEYSGVPVADGGEGTTDAVIAAENGEKVYLDVFGPLMERTRAYYGKFGENKAVLEMAAASGLPMVPMVYPVRFSLYMPPHFATRAGVNRSPMIMGMLMAQENTPRRFAFFRT